MLARRIAERYAEALLDVAQQRQTVEQWESDLHALATLLDASPELKPFLRHPEIPRERKETLLRQVLRDSVAPEVLTTLLLLLKRGHDLDMAAILAVYREIRDKRAAVQPATVTSAVPLDEQQVMALTQALTQRTGCTIRLQRVVDPTLLAGMVITLGDQVIDASARATLDELRETMRA